MSDFKFKLRPDTAFSAVKQIHSKKLLRVRGRGVFYFIDTNGLCIGKRKVSQATAGEFEFTSVCTDNLYLLQGFISLHYDRLTRLDVHERLGCALGTSQVGQHIVHEQWKTDTNGPVGDDFTGHRIDQSKT